MWRVPIIETVLVSDFHYGLPEELIAQEPLADRAGSRLLRLEAGTGRFEDRQFREFPELLRPGDLVVFNNTRVFPARLYGRRGGLRAQAVSQRNPAARDFLQGRIEVLLTRQLREEPNEWECLVRPGRKIGVGEHLFFGEQDELPAEVIGRGGFGERRIRFETPSSFARPGGRGHPSPHEPIPADEFFARVEKIGHVPLPPYIARPDSAADRERYQTVYARERGSVAAPTAGLHFTAEILERIKQRGIETAEVTLHVGLGTFQPVRVERVEEHRLHSEAYSISAEAAEKIGRAKSEGRRVVAIGTTSARTLEYAAQQGGGEVRAAGTGEANLFIYPGYEFQVVGALLTNFHLPQSTLLMLVCALGGRENVLRAYQHAVEQRYRFYSYGDCMLVE
ncbi:MAG: tRNA preQ1(34) S-adenosylmethionine ribosyltransferase-isomerase QueA [Candidatus Sulfotelmatobacter sp.]